MFIVNFIKLIFFIDILINKFQLNLWEKIIETIHQHTKHQEDLSKNKE